MATMFLRALLTAASLTVALAAVVLIDCASGFIEVFGGDPLGVCVADGSVGGGMGMWLGAALGLFAVIGLAATWLIGPVARRLRHPETALKYNLARIPDSGLEPPEAMPASILHAARLTRRLEAIEASLESDSPPTREVTQQWMRLLRDANDLHNSEELASEEFKEINTRVLALFAGPDGEAEEMAATQ